MSFTYALEVQTVKTNWLWEKRVAYGAFTILVGDPGQGKSLLTIDLIREVTTGSGQLPDSTVSKPKGVILIAPEDSNSSTIVPRLQAAGADTSKVLLLSEKEVTGPMVRHIRALYRSHKTRLILKKQL